MTQPYYLYSNGVDHLKDELPIAQKLFGDNFGDLLTNIPAGSTVIPRYRSIPFGQELEKEINNIGSQLINSYHQHRNIADMLYWYPLVEDLTAPCYTIDDYASLPEGDYFLKGETNSKKNNWLESAYAPTKKDILRIFNNIKEDSYIGTQEVIIRPFRKYRKVGESITGQPVFNERRVFTLDGTILTEGYYWSNFIEDFGEPEIINTDKYYSTIQKVIENVSGIARFIVMDFAEYEYGEWELIELNDGCMSGLSNNSPEKLWTNFIKVLNNN